MPFVYYLLRRFGHLHWIPHGRERVIRLFAHPDRQRDLPFEVDFFGARYPGNLRNFIDWNVFFFGAYTRHELLALRDIAAGFRDRGGPVTIFDVGANVGHHTLFMAGIADRVIAFEPLASVRAELERKIAANGVGNVTVRAHALGAENGSATFHPPTGANQGMGSFFGGGPAYGTPITVPMRRGDDVVRDSGLPLPDIVKLDVEGAEAAVLTGLTDTLAAARPFVLMELFEEARARLGGEAHLRRLLYEDADLFALAPRPGSIGYRLLPFDFARSTEILIAPRDAIANMPRLAARMG